MYHDTLIKLIAEIYGSHVEMPPQIMAKLRRLVVKVEQHERNRLAAELQKQPLNDTAQSIAIWIKEQK